MCVGRGSTPGIQSARVGLTVPEFGEFRVGQTTGGVGVSSLVGEGVVGGLSVADEEKMHGISLLVSCAHGHQ